MHAPQNAEYQKFVPAFVSLLRDCLELLEKEPENREYLKFVPKFVDLLREASEHSGIRAFEHSSIYSLRCSQAQMPKCFPSRFCSP